MPRTESSLNQPTPSQPCHPSSHQQPSSAPSLPPYPSSQQPPCLLQSAAPTTDYSPPTPQSVAAPRPTPPAPLSVHPRPSSPPTRSVHINRRALVPVQQLPGGVAIARPRDGPTRLATPLSCLSSFTLGPVFQYVSDGKVKLNRDRERVWPVLLVGVQGSPKFRLSVNKRRTDMATLSLPGSGITSAARHLTGGHLTPSTRSAVCTRPQRTRHVTHQTALAWLAKTQHSQPCPPRMTDSSITRKPSLSLRPLYKTSPHPAHKMTPRRPLSTTPPPPKTIPRPSHSRPQSHPESPPQSHLESHPRCTRRDRRRDRRYPHRRTRPHGGC
jgi:hypothetical protein